MQKLRNHHSGSFQRLSAGRMLWGDWLCDTSQSQIQRANSSILRHVRKQLLVLLDVSLIIYTNIVTIHILYVSLNVMWVFASYRISCLEIKWRPSQIPSRQDAITSKHLNNWSPGSRISQAHWKGPIQKCSCDALYVSSVQLSYFTKD